MSQLTKGLILMAFVVPVTAYVAASLASPGVPDQTDHSPVILRDAAVDETTTPEVAEESPKGDRKRERGSDDQAQQPTPDQATAPQPTVDPTTQQPTTQQPTTQPPSSSTPTPTKPTRSPDKPKEKESEPTRVVTPTPTPVVEDDDDDDDDDGDDGADETETEQGDD